MGEFTKNNWPDFTVPAEVEIDHAEDLLEPTPLSEKTITAGGEMVASKLLDSAIEKSRELFEVARRVGGDTKAKAARCVATLTPIPENLAWAANIAEIVAAEDVLIEAGESKPRKKATKKDIAAVEVLERELLTLSDSARDAYMGLAMIHRNQGNLEAAEKACLVAWNLDLNHKIPEIYVVLERIRGEMEAAAVPAE